MSERSREVTLRFLAQPTDVNFGGKVHGGSIMKWIDQAGYTCATGWSGGYCVTAHIGDVNFYNPVLVGSLVEAHAKIIYTGKTSMHIAVGLRSCDPKRCEMMDSIHCILIFVGIDENGSPQHVPSWRPVQGEDLLLERYAKKLMALRRELHKELGPLEFK